MIESIVLILAWLIIGSAAYAGYSAAPWVPTKKDQRALLLSSINISDQETVYDLGCGTGTIIFDFTKKYRTIKAVGYEISILPYLIAKLKSISNPRTKIIFKSFYSANLYKADTIFIFLTLQAYKKILPTLKTVNPNAQIIIEAWPIPNIEPIKTIRKPDLLPFYIYKGSQFKNI